MGQVGGSFSAKFATWFTETAINMRVSFVLAGAINDVKPAKAIVDEMVTDAVKILKGISQTSIVTASSVNAQARL